MGSHQGKCRQVQGEEAQGERSQEGAFGYFSDNHLVNTYYTQTLS